MFSRDQALSFLNSKITQVNIIKHSLALEALMNGVYEALSAKGISDLGGNKEEWLMAGLLHDADYLPEVPEDKQGVQVVEWLKESGLEIPENVAYCMASHNWENTKVKPKSPMDWTIYCGDSLTGLIVACALVLPTKKLADLKVSSVMKKFKNLSFAGGTRRDSIVLCQGKLGLTLEEFITISLSSMQKIAGDLGL